MKAKRKDMPLVFQENGSYSRDVEWGDMNVAWEGWAAGVDATPLFKGLPDDHCQCPHWGYMIKGRMRIKYIDRDEIVSAGEVYYLPPGHIPIIEEDSELVEFSPKGMYQKTMEVVANNMEKLKQKG